MRDKRLEYAIHHGRSPFRTPVHTPAIAFGLALPLLAILVLTVVFLMGDFSAGQNVLMAAPSVTLVAKRGELKAKSDELAKVFEEAGPEIDLKKVKKMGSDDASTWTTVQKANWIKTRNDELTDLGKEVEQLVDVERAKDANTVIQSKVKDGMVHPAPAAKTGEPGNDRHEIKTLGELMTESADFKNWFEKNRGGRKDKFAIDFPDLYPSDVLAAQEIKGRTLQSKVLFQTGAGWAPQSIRTGIVIEAATRPIGVLDITPLYQTDQAAVVYMEETTRVHAAAEANENGVYAESQFALTQQSSTVRKIADSIPVTDEQLEDVPMVGGYLNNRLIFGVRQRLDGQILVGNGVAPNLLGILNTPALPNQAKGADPTPDAIYKAMTQIRVTGRANPNAVVLHPNDWQDIRLLRTVDGIYIWGSPSEAGPERIWGVGIVQTTGETENTGLVGDFANFCGLFERRGVSVEIGYVNDDFNHGRKTMRADMRAAFVVFRVAAFCTVTGI